MKSPYKKSNEEEKTEINEEENPKEEEKTNPEEQSRGNPKLQLITSEQLIQLRLDVIEGKIDELIKIIKENL